MHCSLKNSQTTHQIKTFTNFSCSDLRVNGVCRASLIQYTSEKLSPTNSAIGKWRLINKQEDMDTQQIFLTCSASAENRQAQAVMYSGKFRKNNLITASLMGSSLPLIPSRMTKYSVCTLKRIGAPILYF